MVRLALALFVSVAVAACAAAEGSEEGATSRAISITRAVAGASKAPGHVAETPARVRSEATVTAAERKPVKPVRKTAFATVAGVKLFHPTDQVLRVGFHQSSDVKNRNMTPTRSAVKGTLLPSRGRATSRHTAADIAVDPRAKITSPVSGIVKRAGDYKLYCKYSDAFVVISPDGHPEIEIKMLHVSGRRVRAGDRVVAGETVVAARSTKFPFSSQIDAFTGRATPHVHIEVTQLEAPSAVPQPNAGLAFGC
jgi:hypothetical protein